MAERVDAIRLRRFDEDIPEAKDLATKWAKVMPNSMRRGRTTEIIRIDCMLGIMAERCLAREIDSTRPGSGALESCLRQQLSKKIEAGPDLLDINVKATNMDRYGITIDQAFARDYRMIVRFGHYGLKSDIYAEVWTTKAEGAWLVGWATKEEVLRGKPLSRNDTSTLCLSVSQLRKPIELFDRY